MTYGGSERNSSFPSFLSASVPIFKEAGHVAPFPRIVVIGDENSGKSSLLRRVAGQNVFPVSERFCTRMPVVLSLKSGDADEIVMRAMHGEAEIASQSINTCDINDVSKKVKLAIDTLNIRVNQDRGVLSDDRSVLSNHSIKIEMQRPDFPDIDFVDLPGLVTDAGARDATAQLTDSCIMDDNAILLWVVSDFSDSLRVNLTLARLQTAVSSRSSIQDRVVVALTKSDMSIHGHNADGRRIKERLSDLQTTFGFTPAAVIPVISPPGFDSSIALQTEEQNLNEMSIPAPRGLNGLLRETANIAERITKTVWIPRILTKLSAEIEEINAVLNGYGPPPANRSVSDVLASLSKCIWQSKDLTSVVSDHLDFKVTCWPSMIYPPLPSKRFSDLTPCEQSCVRLAWDRQIFEFREKTLDNYPEVVKQAIKSAILQVPISSQHLERLDFTFIVDKFEPRIPDVCQMVKSAPSSSLDNLATDFKKHISGCFYDWIVFPLVQIIDDISKNGQITLTEETPFAAERSLTEGTLSTKEDLKNRLESWRI